MAGLGQALGRFPEVLLSFTQTLLLRAEILVSASIVREYSSELGGNFAHFFDLISFVRSTKAPRVLWIASATRSAARIRSS